MTDEGVVILHRGTVIHEQEVPVCVEGSRFLYVPCIIHEAFSNDPLFSYLLTPEVNYLVSENQRIFLNEGVSSFTKTSTESHVPRPDDQ